MKRSEALKIIDEQYSQFVKDWLDLDITNDEMIKSFTPLNERILNALESAGMLPPYVFLDGIKKSDMAWEPE